MLRPLYLGLLLFAVGTFFFVAIVAWQNRRIVSARTLSIMAVFGMIWAGGMSGVDIATSEALMWLFHRTAYIGMIFVPISWIVLAFQFTDRGQYVTRRTVGALVAVGLGFIVFVWTNPGGWMYWTAIEYDPTILGGVRTSPGPGFVAFVVFVYLLLGGGSLLLIRYGLRTPDLYTQQTAAILIAVFIPWATNIPTVLQIVQVDWTPVGIAIAAAAYGWAIIRYELTDIRPVARRTVLQTISTGVAVLDQRGRVVDVNPACRSLLEIDDDDDLGTTADKVLPIPIVAALPDGIVAGTAPEISSIQTQVQIEHASEPRYYRLSIDPIHTEGGRHVGYTVSIDDVTEQQQRRQQLERQNEQLDQFASIVSHDLRNPLNVATARLDLAQEESDSEHLDHLSTALNRMETLIEDVLTLARQGNDISDVEAVALADLVEQCRVTIDTSDATLVVETEAVIHADPNRVQQLLENLIRNAIEHGREDVTVTVGDLENGFYVEDDGPGISPDDRDTVFETGYTTSQDGTGFGLSIVDQIAKAHDWTINVTDSNDGGARFEITGVEFRT